MAARCPEGNAMKTPPQTATERRRDDEIREVIANYLSPMVPFGTSPTSRARGLMRLLEAEGYRIVPALSSSCDTAMLDAVAARARMVNLWTDPSGLVIAAVACQPGGKQTVRLCMDLLARMNGQEETAE